MKFNFCGKIVKNMVVTEMWTCLGVVTHFNTATEFLLRHHDGLTPEERLELQNEPDKQPLLEKHNIDFISCVFHNFTNVNIKGHKVFVCSLPHSKTYSDGAYFIGVALEILTNLCGLKGRSDSENISYDYPYEAPTKEIYYNVGNKKEINSLRDDLMATDCLFAKSYVYCFENDCKCCS